MDQFDILLEDTTSYDHEIRFFDDLDSSPLNLFMFISIFTFTSLESNTGLSVPCFPG